MKHGHGSFGWRRFSYVGPICDTWHALLRIAWEAEKRAEKRNVSPWALPMEENWRIFNALGAALPG
ncbi:MAG: hypothetical protein CL807_05345 [Citromicrobium sp.]|nr:hypothetical protein [Citromicrobium sp.]